MQEVLYGFNIVLQDGYLSSCNTSIVNISLIMASQNVHNISAYLSDFKRDNFALCLLGCGKQSLVCLVVFSIRHLPLWGVCFQLFKSSFPKTITCFANFNGAGEIESSFTKVS